MTSNHANDGRGFEQTLERICGVYAERGLARFCKTEPPTRTFGTGFNRKVIYLPNPFLDYAGCITSMGNRAAFFEAKSTGEPTLPCGDKGSFSQSQRDAMADWRQAGAASWLLWEYRGACRIFFHAMIQAGLSERKSLVWDDGIDVPQGTGYLLHDFMPLLKRYEAQL
jgi:hypothetical protein